MVGGDEVLVGVAADGQEIRFRRGGKDAQTGAACCVVDDVAALVKLAQGDLFGGSGITEEVVAADVRMSTSMSGLTYLAPAA